MTDANPRGSPSLPDGWHLDKRVPIAMIFTIALQTCGAVWWAASVQAGIETANRERISLANRVAAIEMERNSFSDRIIRLETKLDTQTQLLTQILDTLRGNGRPSS